MTDGTHTHDERDETDDDSDGPVDREQVAHATRLLLDAIGEDPEREGLVETWERRVPAAYEELTQGYREDERPTMRTFDAESDDLVVKTGIPVYSLCEHHLLPFHGVAHVAYRPAGAVVGLSKLARYVRWASRKLTVQERLTRDIAEGLDDAIGADAVAVELSATHLCEAMRGVEAHTTTTSRATVGELTTPERERFRDAIAAER
ncbi:GTP cyclohydrolase I type 1 [Halarchaeum acidiphilum MH1-52-1]|uniref:GTP cyclohydrolase I n=1 Tax=Halarchaeum acidiphilum MH1-52-1 TaxID=1261545 RepID=U3AGH6_9EURY|nr:GTP cyclohydrolase I [Halarchaeum acidiphilum]GAD53893.1 GTP cyclohydrolase I type 1 [Halarchaeum acidiphilum MH1-52-1]